MSKDFLGCRHALSDGSLQIPSGRLLLDPSDKHCLGEFTTVASWDTIDATNDILYVTEQTSGANSNRAIALTTGPHDLESLAAATQKALNGSTKEVPMETYVVAHPSTGAGGATSRACRVARSNGLFELPSDTAAVSSTNNLFTFTTGGCPSASRVSDFVDLGRAPSIFTHAPGLERA